VSCDSINAASRQFCGECGTELWRDCVNCRVKHAASDKFCGHCGVNFDEFQRTTAETRRRELEEVRSLIDEHRYDDAHLRISGLLRTAGAAHGCGTAHGDGLFIDQVNQLRQVVDRLRLEWGEKITEALETARAALKRYEYEKSVVALTAIPPALRTPELNGLLLSAETTIQELVRLRSELDQAILDDRVVLAMSILDRLLAIVPHDADLLAKSDWLTPRLLLGAKKLVAGHKFEEAEKLLLALPPSCHNDESRGLLEQVSEVVCHFEEIRTAPLATPILLGMADRLCKILPRSELAKRLRQELAAKLAGASANSAGPPPNGVPETSSPLGMPVVLPRVPANGFAVAAEILGQLNGLPGQYFVALGLALHGMGEAAIECNLMPRKSSLLGGLALTASRPKAAWGIDLGSSALKAVRLSWDADRKLYQITHAEHLPIPERPRIPEQKAEALRAVIETFVSRHRLQGARVVANMPGINVLFKQLRLPLAEGKQRSALIEHEVRHQIPYPITECVVSHAESRSDRDPSNVDSRSSETSAPVLMFASKRSVVDDRVEVFSRCGVRLDRLLSESLALHNFACWQRASSGRQSVGEAELWIDVGDQYTQMVVSGQNVFWYRVLPHGSAAYSGAISRELHVVRADAEAIKQLPLRARRLSHLRRAWEPVFEKQLSEAVHTLKQAREALPGVRLSHAVLCGGGAQMHGFLRQFSRS
jgi:Tfp pilus assembly PilM family ATPase